MHGEMIPAKESTCMESWSHPGEPERIHASPNQAPEEIFPETFIVFSALCFCFSCCLLLL